MKVKDLIAKLQEYDEDMEVFVTEDSSYNPSGSFITAECRVGDLHVSGEYGYSRSYTGSKETKVVILEG